MLLPIQYYQFIYQSIDISRHGLMKYNTLIEAHENNSVSIYWPTDQLTDMNHLTTRWPRCICINAHAYACVCVCISLTHSPNQLLISVVDTSTFNDSLYTFHGRSLTCNCNVSSDTCTVWLHWRDNLKIHFMKQIAWNIIKTMHGQSMWGH